MRSMEDKTLLCLNKDYGVPVSILVKIMSLNLDEKRTYDGIELPNFMRNKRKGRGGREKGL